MIPSVRNLRPGHGPRGTDWNYGSSDGPRLGPPGLRISALGPAGWDRLICGSVLWAWPGEEAGRAGNGLSVKPKPPNARLRRAYCIPPLVCKPLATTIFKLQSQSPNPETHLSLKASHGAL